MSQMSICLIIFVLTVILYASNLIPMAATAIISLVALSVTGCLDPKVALNGLSNPNTVVLISMFVVAAGLNRTQMIHKLSDLVYKIGKGSFVKVFGGYLLVAFILGQFVTSPVVIFGIVYPMLPDMCERFGIKTSKVMFPLMLVCITTSSMLPFGSGAALFAKFNGFLETYEYTTYMFDLFTLFWAKLPIVIAIIVYSLFFAPKFAPDEPVVAIGDVKGRSLEKKEPLSPVREVLGYTIFLAVTVGIIFQKQIGLELWQITVGGAVLMVACGVLKEQEAIKAMNIWMGLLYAGALAMGTALTETGAGEMIGDFIVKLIGGSSNGYLLGAIFFVVTWILTQFMVNSGVMNIFWPIAILTAKSLGCSPIGLIILVQTGATTAYMTPMATPAVPMAMAAGGYDMRSTIKQGILPGLLMGIISVLWIMTIYPAFP